ncbi:MAG TPA: hypothetical protein VFE37_14615 [Chloroflexota bacterium]|nr:hypothetical protein [Chloroflexota bacterium]
MRVAFYGAHGEYVLLAAARSPEAARWVARVLAEHGATVQELPPVERLAELPKPRKSASGPGNRRDEPERAMVARWAGAALLLIEQGLLGPDDLLALLVAAGERANRFSPDERRARLQAADAELQAVTQQLASRLQARYPELFDRRGRLRAAELTRRLMARTGGKVVLSGDELRALENESDPAAGRSVRAP